jgi:hypothetical protein
MKDKYPARSSCYDLLGEQLVVIDRNAPRHITMDPWPELIFSASNGKRTVEQIISELAEEYVEGPPPDLEANIIWCVEMLLSEGLIELSPEPKVLPFYLMQPWSQVDKELAMAAMIRDGFIKDPGAS